MIFSLPHLLSVSHATLKALRYATRRAGVVLTAARHSSVFSSLFSLENAPLLPRLSAVRCFHAAASRLFFRSCASNAPFISRTVENGKLLARPGKGPLALVKFHGIKDRTAASALTGCLIFVHPKQSLASLPPNSILAADLIGFEVTLLHDAARTRIGRVTDVVSKHDMGLREEAVGAADDCLQIEVFKDLPARRLLAESFLDPAPPQGPLLASALHALGSEVPPQEGEEAEVLFECEGCGLRFSDCAAAVCHERLCTSQPPSTGGDHRSEGGLDSEGGALQWLLQTAAASPETPQNLEGSESLLSPSGPVPDAAVRADGRRDPGAVAGLGAPGGLLAGPPPRELRTLEGPNGRAGARLGSRFLERLSLGDQVSWERGPRFFPRQREGALEAAERALDFACSSGAGQNYVEANWNDPEDVAAVCQLLGPPSDLRPALCNTDAQPSGQSFLLPFALGVTVDEVNIGAKTLGINAPPALLH
ncbi:uncharacterized protein LOC34620655 [Cyclospora cayetanensis]|uniref:Uncharacterized protein LOC34620655 n=1 Tax=Cyclospora cayetanensis TaxID=88456 RepID=A0A6P6S0Q9_9EIME|nr:uncharacterized protein LOC34620655 [Cyclospora cayetanensis]